MTTIRSLFEVAMPFVLCPHRSVLTIVFGVLLVGCVAHRTDDRCG